MEGSDTILIIGGGIAGIQAALDAANAGAKVVLVERGPVIGGVMALLDKNFPTLDCSICIEAPKIGDAIRHPNIEVITLAEVIDLQGVPGNYEVTIYQRPRYVTSDCTKCGKCSEECPVAVPFEVDGGISLRKAIYLPFPQAEPGWYVIDIQNCLNDPPGYMPCDRCIRACEPGAIDFTMKPKIIKKRVAAVVVAAGYDLMDPSKIPEYGYGKYPDVLTGLEFERLLNASGPTEGEILRPSDGKHVEKLLFVTCVGSRDVRHAEYCSRFCCMYTLKQSIQAKEHGVKHVTALFMDIRAYGKGFEHFYKRALEEGVEIIRGRLAEVREKNGRLVAVFEDTLRGTVEEREYDMIVLAPSVLPSNGLEKLAKALGIQVDRDGFLKLGKPWSPVETTRPGVYVAGSAAGPKDIADTVQEAGAATALALSHLKGLRLAEEEFKETITDVEEPRIGVFVCHCGSNIAGVVDVAEVRDYAAKLPNVVHSEDLKFACSAASVEYIAQVIREKKLNRIVVAACSPATHLGVFRTAAKMAGLNPFLVDLANIRNLDSWVHRDTPKEATEKAKDYVKMAVMRAPLLQPLKTLRFPVVKRVLVVGGGIAGMKAAAAAARLGLETVLVEKEPELGGVLRKLRLIAPEGVEAKKVLDEALEELRAAGVKVYTGTTVEKVEGFVGNFRVELSNGEKLEVGAIIMATGAKVHQPTHLGYGERPNIYTLLDLESKGYNVPGENVVFIACVGSRNEKRGCSRYCCTSMIHQALHLRRMGKNVAIVYKDIRTYSRGAEELYRKAAEEGVVFLKVSSLKPVEESIRITDEGVVVQEELLRAEVLVPADAIVMATALEPNPDIEPLVEQLKISRDMEGFLLESHPKLGPVESPVPGVMLAGTAQGPKDLRETVAQAYAAAAKAAALLNKGYVEKEPLVAVIDQSKCIKCGACMRVCPYNAIKGEVRKHIEVVQAACEGCGACVAECPTGAIFIPGFKDEDIYRQLEAALSEEPWEKPIAFTCFWCSYAAADNTGIFKVQYPASPRIIRLPCSSRVSWRLVKKAFMLGAPAVAVTGCRLGDCHYQNANVHTVRRFKAWKKLLEKAGVREDRFILRLFGAPDVPDFVDTMKTLDKVRKTVTKEEIQATVEALKRMKP